MTAWGVVERAFQDVVAPFLLNVVKHSDGKKAELANIEAQRNLIVQSIREKHVELLAYPIYGSS